ncbi:penicillin-binding protein, partial [Streptococcus pneumoniae]
NTGYVAPDEMFVGYTRKYSMAVWTGYSNRLTPIIGDGFLVAGRVYRSMMTYLSEDNHPGDWTMPEGLYRSGEFVFKNGARSTWSSPAPQQPPSAESSSSSSDSSTSQSSSTTPSTNNSTTTNPNNNTQQSNTTPDQQNQNPQPAQP